MRNLFIFLTLVIASLTVACGSDSEVTTDSVPEPAATASPSVTSPAVTQTGTLTPAPGAPDSLAVIAAFKSAGLEAENPTPMTREDYGFAPLLAKEGTHFLIPSLGDGAGGRAMSFNSDADLLKTQDYYVGLGKTSAALFSHVFIHGRLLVQINGNLPDAMAAKYQVALEQVGRATATPVATTQSASELRTAVQAYSDAYLTGATIYLTQEAVTRTL